MMRVLILGSGPAAPQAAAWPKAAFDRIVVINNAWRIRPDWDDCIFPEDFPTDRHPQDWAPGQRLIQADAFVPAQNAYGGFFYAGATMAYTAAYWALADMRPSCLAFMGCDMTYATAGATHFYGTGAADPLRDDPSLRSLEAKSARLMVHAARQGCAVVNLSTDPSRLVAPRARIEDLSSVQPVEFETSAANAADQAEARLNHRTPTGWIDRTVVEPDLPELDAIDRLWLRAVDFRSTPGPETAP